MTLWSVRLYGAQRGIAIFHARVVAPSRLLARLEALREFRATNNPRAIHSFTACSLDNFESYSRSSRQLRFLDPTAPR